MVGVSPSLPMLPCSCGGEWRGRSIDVNSEIEVDAPEVRVKKGVILARRKNYFSTAKKMMSSGVGCWGVCCVWGVGGCAVCGADGR